MFKFRRHTVRKQRILTIKNLRFARSFGFFTKLKAENILNEDIFNYSVLVASRILNEFTLEDNVLTIYVQILENHWRNACLVTLVPAKNINEPTITPSSIDQLII